MRDTEIVPARDVRQTDLITVAAAVNGAGETVKTHGEVLTNTLSRRNKRTGYRDIQTIAGTVLTVPNRFPIERVKV